MIPRGLHRLVLWCDVPLNEVVTAHVLLGAMLIGVGVGFLSGAFGKGGSAIATPLLHLLGVPAMVAIASPLPATIPSTLLASRAYTRARPHRPARRAPRAADRLAADGRRRMLTRWIPGGPLVLATDVFVLAFGLRILLHGRSGRQADPTRTADVERDRGASRIVAVVGGSASCRVCSATAADSCSHRCSSACSACRCTARSEHRSLWPRASRSPAHSCTPGSATSTGRSRSAFGIACVRRPRLARRSPCARAALAHLRVRPRARDDGRRALRPRALKRRQHVFAILRRANTENIRNVPRVAP